ncbi:peptidylprolyl isomerase [Nocardioides sp. SOB77]|uniref:Peptidylprolyl isomerase n=1 Tax=Nocardioides oceani TaxID=3058369 RepID=A0ABT8FK69_9ACTN|nr:peptidylprolyl isomerase [Nocardioides oceani]MDN4175083.1 peptidylprolyl isomerase [Nocardioides oceani]
MLKRPLAALATLAAVSLLASCGDDEGSSAAPEKQADGPSCTYAEDGQPAAKEVELPPSRATVSGTVTGTITTSVGDIGLELDADKAPCTVGSFVSLAEQEYFDDTTCHRLTTAGILVLQCGDPTATGTGGPGYTVPDEIEGDETYPDGTLAMANTGAPDSGGSQFFIVYGDTPLDPAYTVFGTVDEAGLKVVQEAAKAGTGPDGVAPATPVDIESVTIDE